MHEPQTALERYRRYASRRHAPDVAEDVAAQMVLIALENRKSSLRMFYLHEQALRALKLRGQPGTTEFLDHAELEPVLPPPPVYDTFEVREYGPRILRRLLAGLTLARAVEGTPVARTTVLGWVRNAERRPSTNPHMHTFMRLYHAVLELRGRKRCHPAHLDGRADEAARILREGGTPHEAERVTGVSHRTLRRWRSATNGSWYVQEFQRKAGT